MKNKTPEIKGSFFYSHATKQSLVHNPLTIERRKKVKNKILKIHNHENGRKPHTIKKKLKLCRKMNPSKCKSKETTKNA